MDKLKSSFQSIANIKKKQWINLGLGAAVVLVTSWGIWCLVAEDQSSTPPQHDETAVVNMSDPLTHVNESSVWVERTQNVLAKTQKTTESLQQPQLGVF